MSNLDSLIDALAQHMIQNNVPIQSTLRKISKRVHELAPNRYWVRHRNGCTKEMRERKYIQAKQQIRTALTTDPLSKVGLSPERIRQLTKQTNEPD